MIHYATALVMFFSIISLCPSVVMAEDGEAKRKPPTTVSLNTLEDKYEPVEFNHKFHTMVADGCQICHHQHGTGQPVVCMDCHSLDSKSFKKAVIHTFLPCRKCHGELNRNLPSMPSLKVAYHRQCFGCHLGSDGIGEDPKACAEKCHEARSVGQHRVKQAEQ